MWQKELNQVPSIGAKITQLRNGTYPNIPRKITHVSQLTTNDLQYLPRESSLAIQYLDGNQFTRSEIEELTPIINQLIPRCNWIFAGSYRRNKTILNDADIITINCTKNTFTESANIKVVKFGLLKARLLIKANTRFIPVDIAFTDGNPAALMHYTGSKEFNIKMRKLAITKGYKLNEYGLWKAGKKLKIKTEADIFKKLQTKYLHPSER